MKNIDINCCFCREALGMGNENVSRIYPEISNRDLHKSEKLRMVPCIGQLVPDHFMIITNSHYSSFGEALHFDCGLGEELGDMIVLYRDTFAECGGVFMFEHGVSGPSMGGCGIYHAHIHVIPDSKVLRESFLGFFPSGDAVGDYDLDNFIRGRLRLPENYLLIGVGDKVFVQSKTEPVESQYLRRRVSEALGLGEWNWRNFGRQSSFVERVSFGPELTK